MIRSVDHRGSGERAASLTPIGRGSPPRRFRGAAIPVLLLLSVAIGSPEPLKPDEYWPARDWRTSSPERQGISSEELGKLMDQIKERGIEVDSIVVIRNGYVVLDATFYPFPKGSVHDIASVTKSITSLATGIAIDRHFIKDVREPVPGFFKDRSTLSSDGKKRNLTIENLLTMTSGLCRDIDEGEEQTGRMEQSGDGVQYMLDRPLVSEPGSDFVYCSLGPHLLSAILTRATGMNLQRFAEANLFAPLGIHGVLWDSDSQGNSHGWGDLFIRPMDLARIGYLMLREGRWDGKQVVSREWVRASSKARVFESGGTGYGYLWWVPKEPKNLYEGRGRGGQRLEIWPAKNLVVVLIGSGGYTLGGIGGSILGAIKSDGLLPDNPGAERLLEEKLEAASRAPLPAPVSALPAMATKVSGKNFLMEPNPLGMRSFTLVFSSDKEASLRLYVDQGHPMGAHVGKVIPVGLDGVYRLANTSKNNLTAAARGSWVSDRDFVVAYKEASNNKNWRFNLHFDEDSARCTVTEATGLIDETTVRARMAVGSAETSNR